MKLIKETEATYISNNRTRMGLFECPECLRHVEKRMSSGKVNKTCGAKECKSKALSRGSILRKYDGQARRTHGMSTPKKSTSKSYTALKSMWKDTIKDDTTWTKLADFVTDMRVPMENAKLGARNGSVKLRKHDKAKPHSKDNTYFDISDTRKRTLWDEAIGSSELTNARLSAEYSTAWKLVNKAIMELSEVSEVFSTLDISNITETGRELITLTTEQYYMTVDKVLSTKECNPSTMVYILRTDYVVGGNIVDAYKIGITGNMQNRMASMRTSNPNQIDIIFCSDTINFSTTVEAYLHQRFSNDNIRGEWFNITEEIVNEVIAELSSNTPLRYATAYFKQQREQELEEAQQDLSKQELLDNMSKNLTKLDTAYKAKQEALIDDTEIATVPKSTHDKSGFKCKEYEVPSRWKPVYQFTVDGEFIKQFDSVKQAMKETGITQHISSVCNGDRNIAGGFRWSYEPTIDVLLTQTRVVNKPIKIYKNCKHIDTMTVQSEIAKKYDISTTSLKRRIDNGKEWKGLTFIREV
jgi:hypothetical protein